MRPPLVHRVFLAVVPALVIGALALGAALGGIALALAAPPVLLVGLMVLGLGALFLLVRKPFASFALAAGMATVLPAWIAGATSEVTSRPCLS